jgi:hypothetical protein
LKDFESTKVFVDTKIEAIRNSREQSTVPHCSNLRVSSISLTTHTIEYAVNDQVREDKGHAEVCAGDGGDVAAASGAMHNSIFDSIVETILIIAR